MGLNFQLHRIKLFYNLSLTLETTRLNRQTECGVRRIRQSRTGGPPKQQRRPSDGATWQHRHRRYTRRVSTSRSIPTWEPSHGGGGGAPDLDQLHVQAVLSSGSGQNTAHAHNVTRDAPCRQMPDGNIPSPRNTAIYPQTWIFRDVIQLIQKQPEVQLYA